MTTYQIRGRTFKMFIQLVEFSHLGLRSTFCRRSHMGKASHRSGGTGCGSSELPVWCTSCHRKDTSLDLLRRNVK